MVTGEHERAEQAEHAGDHGGDAVLGIADVHGDDSREHEHRYRLTQFHGEGARRVEHALARFARVVGIHVGDIGDHTVNGFADGAQDVLGSDPFQEQHSTLRESALLGLHINGETVERLGKGHRRHRERLSLFGLFGHRASDKGSRRYGTRFCRSADAFALLFVFLVLVFLIAVDFFIESIKILAVIMYLYRKDYDCYQKDERERREHEQQYRADV